MKNLSRPSVYDYFNYREFLEAMSTWFKIEKKISMRQLLKAGDIRGASLPSMIMKGERNLSEEMARKFARAFQLKKNETEFFAALVRYTHAVATEEKDYLFKALTKYKNFKQTQHLNEAYFDLFSNWWTIAIFEALSTNFGGYSLKEMAQSLNIETDRVRESLQALESLELIEKVNGEWRKKKDSLNTPREMQSHLVRKYHQEIIHKALESMDRDPLSEREITSQTLALSEHSYIRLKKLVQELQEQIERDFTEQENPKAVYQLNIQLFPVVKLLPNETA